MDTLRATVLGLVQGITDFPVPGAGRLRVGSADRVAAARPALALVTAGAIA